MHLYKKYTKRTVPFVYKADECVAVVAVLQFQNRQYEGKKVIYLYI